MLQVKILYEPYIILPRVYIIVSYLLNYIYFIEIIIFIKIFFNSAN